MRRAATAEAVLWAVREAWPAAEGYWNLTVRTTAALQILQDLLPRVEFSADAAPRPRFEDFSMPKSGETSHRRALTDNCLQRIVRRERK